MIVFKEVTKEFGSKKALDQATMIFPKGEITGFLGPNGSGKSTSLKMIAGLNRPDRGTVMIEGEKPSIHTKRDIAYLPEIDYIYPWMTIGEAANFTKSFYEDWDEKKYNELIDFLHLEPSMAIKKISKGMRAKAKLLLTFSRDAKIILLDEPLSGIDILTRDTIIQTIIRDYRVGEQTIIISTHEIQEIEGLIDKVIFMDKGRAILEGEAEVLRSERNMSLVELMKEVYGHVSF